MQQYIYGNIGHKGYGYVSSRPDFFTDAHRLSVLNHLVRYNVYAEHGSLVPGEHQCCWMTTSNLDDAREPERLFLQVSCSDLHRTGYFARGYMSDPEDGDLYGPQLLQLLRTRFEVLSEIQTLAEQGNLKPVKPTELPVDGSRKPAVLPPAVLKSILLELIRNKRVVLRLPVTGRAAMDFSREVLLAVYERLPWERRRKTGFLTGATANEICGTVDERANGVMVENELPAGIRLILMDADAGVEKIIFDKYQTLIDMTDPDAALPTVPRAYIPLIDFLAEQPVETLDAYFRFCRSYIEDGTAGSELEFSDYQMLLELFQIGRGAVNDETIRTWAANLQEGKWSERLKNRLYDQIAEALDPEVLKAYLCGAVSRFDELAVLGVQHSEKIKDGSGADLNAAQTLRMTEKLLNRYPEGTGDSLRDAMSRRFVELECEANPCLREKRPTKATADALGKLAFPEKVELPVPLAEAVRKQTCVTLNAMREGILETYSRELAAQNAEGLRQIGQWSFENDRDTGGLERLYRQLREHYLFEELRAVRTGACWNTRIGERLTDQLVNSTPGLLEDYENLCTLTGAALGCFEKNGGVLSAEQKQAIETAETKWNDVLELNSRTCQTVEQLLVLFEEIDRAGLYGPTAQGMKERYTRGIVEGKPTGSRIAACVEGLCARAKKSPQERALLRQAVGAARDLNVIPKGWTLAQEWQRLDVIRALTGAGLFEGTVYFQPWTVQDTAERLMTQISALRCYSRGKPAPDLENAHVRQWAVEMLTDNTALQLLMAERYPGLRGQIIRTLAQKPDGVSVEEIRGLYLKGCSKAVLRRGAGENTAESWKLAMEELFPAWIGLPAPQERPAPKRDRGNLTLMLTEIILLALAGLFLPAALLIPGKTSVLVWAAETGVLALVALGCVAAGAMNREGQKKQLLNLMGAALLPGILVSVAALILMIL